MQTKFMKRAAFGAVAVAAMLLTGAAQAVLQDRDLDGDTVTDAFYDTDLDITWLRDANVNGATMDWYTAVAWADGFSFGGHTGWRLPTSDDCDQLDCTGSEMGHLWYIELGNLAGVLMTNRGDFQNLQAWGYWSGTEYAPQPSEVYYFSAYSGVQNITSKDHTIFYAMAVTNGDVGMVPEPETYALMLAGLAALVLARRRQRR